MVLFIADSARLKAAVRSPGRAISVLRAIAKGQWCLTWCRLRGVRFEAGRNLRVFGTLSIKGPGLVRFGDDVVVDMTVTPWTNDRKAVIEIGDGTFLNGTRFSCSDRIVIGPRSILATATILDTNFHSLDVDRHNPNAEVKAAPVWLGANVWVAARAGILPGTTIGDNSVVGFGAVCSGEYPANTLIASPRATVVRQLTCSPANAVQYAPTVRLTPDPTSESGGELLEQRAIGEHLARADHDG